MRKMQIAEDELFGGWFGIRHRKMRDGGRGNIGGKHAGVAQRYLADHVANQFTASSGCILLNGSFCFGYLPGQAALFVSLPPLHFCSLTGGANVGSSCGATKLATALLTCKETTHFEKNMETIYALMLHVFLKSP